MFTTDVGTINTDYPAGVISAADGAMTVGDLHGILTASKEAGLRRFLFPPAPDLGASEWRVTSGLCGNLWEQSRNGYWPPDSKKPDEFNR